ncbi:expressed unknown protein [Seminavis robusta]|uniref:Uncharacterized protein n=1 Tax=Seminavis robusta TaxID=568900 RepID=A0A9N8DL71_9STRA|nr:expressed unknown protein [Seminavis robusta]|eukprot:Sro205_g086310.1 n/a (169) ;mRNA; r:66740-67246
MMGDVGIVSHQQRSTKTHVFEVELDKTTKIVFDTFMDMVSVSVIANNSAEDFSGSVGLLGANGTGRMLARDGTTLLENDVTGFGQEWQVRDSDHKLFQVVDRFPQHPDACVMPTMTTASERRRLGEWMISKEDAREVCAMWKHKRDMTACMYDVMFTGNLASALTGVF